MRWLSIFTAQVKIVLHRVCVCLRGKQNYAPAYDVSEEIKFLVLWVYQRGRIDRGLRSYLLVLIQKRLLPCSSQGVICKDRGSGGWDNATATHVCVRAHVQLGGIDKRGHASLVGSPTAHPPILAPVGFTRARTHTHTHTRTHAQATMLPCEWHCPYMPGRHTDASSVLNPKRNMFTRRRQMDSERTKG